MPSTILRTRGPAEMRDTVPFEVNHVPKDCAIIQVSGFRKVLRGHKLITPLPQTATIRIASDSHSDHFLDGNIELEDPGRTRA